MENETMPEKEALEFTRFMKAVENMNSILENICESQAMVAKAISRLVPSIDGLSGQDEVAAIKAILKTEHEPVEVTSTSEIL